MHEVRVRTFGCIMLRFIEAVNLEKSDDISFASDSCPIEHKIVIASKLRACLAMSFRYVVWVPRLNMPRADVMPRAEDTVEPEVKRGRKLSSI